MSRLKIFLFIFISIFLLSFFYVPRAQAFSLSEFFNLIKPDNLPAVLGDDDDNSGSSDDNGDNDNSGSGNNDDKDEEDNNSGSGNNDSDEDSNDDSDNSGSGSNDGEGEDRELKVEERIENKDGTTTRIKREIKNNEEKVEVKTYDRFGNKIGENKFEKKEEENENKEKSEEVVQNEDGTVIRIRREIKEGEEKVRIVTYDSFGNKISDEEYKRDEGEEKIRLKTYSGTGDKLSDLRLETKDGKVLELRIKEGGEDSRLKYDVRKNELLVRVGSGPTPSVSTDSTDVGEEFQIDEENTLRIKVSDPGFNLIKGNANALVKFPLVVDEETGEVFVTTPNGQIRLGIMPDAIVERARAAQNLRDVVQLEVVPGSSVEESSTVLNDTNLEYLVTGAKSERLLGMFSINIPQVLRYDAQNATLLEAKQTIAFKLLDLLSF